MKKLALLGVVVLAVSLVGVISANAGIPVDQGNVVLPVVSSSDYSIPQIKELSKLPVERIDEELSKMQNVKFKRLSADSGIIMPSPLAMELSNALSRTEDEGTFNLDNIIWAIRIVDHALGDAGSNAVVYPRDTAVLAQSLILLADVASITEDRMHTHVALQGLAPELAEKLDGASSGIGGQLLAKDIFDFAISKILNSLKITTIQKGVDKIIKDIKYKKDIY